MKHTIEFQLPEDQYDLDLHNNIANYICTIINIDEELRRIIKYEQISEETLIALTRIRNLIDLERLTL